MLSGITGEAAYQWGVVIGASLIAAVCDLRSRRIPNVLTLPLLTAGLVHAILVGGLSGLAEAAAACLLLAMPYVFMFLFASGGAGDAKLMGAIGAWLGLAHGAVVLLCVAVAGIFLAVAKAVAQKRLKLILTNVLLNVWTFLWFLIGRKKMTQFADNVADSEHSYRLSVPYGVAILVGVCVSGGVVWLW
ncbi:MAG: A24 family peptidase [Planctomycetota bacterium]